MSEFPEWLECRLGLHGPSYEEAEEIHAALRVIRLYVPDLDERLRELPDPKWSFWRRYLWYASQ